MAIKLLKFSSNCRTHLISKTLNPEIGILELKLECIKLCCMQLCHEFGYCFKTDTITRKKIPSIPGFNFFSIFVVFK